MTLTEPLMVMIYTRLDLDEADRAFQAFTHPLGHYPLRTKVLNALHLFWPTDENGNALTMSRCT